MITVRKIETEEELEMIPYLEGPWRNDACLGYLVLMMQHRGHSHEWIETAIRQMEGCFDLYSVKEAVKAYYDFVN